MPAVSLEQVVHGAARITFEIANHSLEITVASGDEMEMIGHEDISHDLEVLLLPAVAEAVEYRFSITFVDKDGQPGKSCDCAEVSKVFVGAVTGHGSSIAAKRVEGKGLVSRTAVPR